MIQGLRRLADEIEEGIVDKPSRITLFLNGDVYSLGPESNEILFEKTVTDLNYAIYKLMNSIE